MHYFDDSDKQGLAIISISVANIRRLPVFQSELLNQTLLGTIVAYYDFQNDFYYIQNRDGHFGWVNKHSLIPVSDEKAHYWYHHPKIYVHANYAVIRKADPSNGLIITDVVPTISLPVKQINGSYATVELPTGEEGFLPRETFLTEEEQQAIPATGEQVVLFAKKFLGVPYLWGGTSAKGFDCSGFVQTVYRLLNIDLPRDSGQMFTVGTPVGTGKEESDLQPGDLIFFGKNRRRINHVAIYMGEGLYIHARGKVTINSIRPEHPLFEPYLFDLIIEAQRILPQRHSSRH